MRQFKQCFSRFLVSYLSNNVAAFWSLEKEECFPYQLTIEKFKGLVTTLKRGIEDETIYIHDTYAPSAVWFEFRQVADAKILYTLKISCLDLLQIYAYVLETDVYPEFEKLLKETLINILIYHPGNIPCNAPPVERFDTNWCITAQVNNSKEPTVNFYATRYTGNRLTLTLNCTFTIDELHVKLARAFLEKSVPTK